MPRIVITGDRRWGVVPSEEDGRDDKAVARERSEMERELANWLVVDDVVLIEGEAPGADQLSRIIGEALGYRVERFPAQWDKYGRAAGPVRNQQMIDEGKPDMALAFHHDLTKSKGTADMVRRCRKAGLPIKLITGKIIIHYPAGGGEPEYPR